MSYKMLIIKGFDLIAFETITSRTPQSTDIQFEASNSNATIQIFNDESKAQVSIKGKDNIIMDLSKTRGNGETMWTYEGF